MNVIAILMMMMMMMMMIKVALGYGLDEWGLESRQESGIFLFTTASRTALGPAQPPIQWIPGGSFPGSKAAGS
jgi:hypothetical protein